MLSSVRDAGQVVQIQDCPGRSGTVGTYAIINLPISFFTFLFLFFLFSFNFSLASYLLHCTRLCPIVILILSPPPPFLFVLFT